MSALGQKRTCAAHKLMSALPPIATLIAFFGMSVLGQKAYLLIDRPKQNDRLAAVSPTSQSGFSLRQRRSAFCATNCSSVSHILSVGLAFTYTCARSTNRL